MWRNFFPLQQDIFCVVVWAMLYILLLYMEVSGMELNLASPYRISDWNSANTPPPPDLTTDTTGVSPNIITH